MLYRALKAFGQIIKSLFILRYLDDLALRQAVEQQLSRVELANRFTRAVAVGSPRELLQAEKEDQEIAEACNRLIKNSIAARRFSMAEGSTVPARNEATRRRISSQCSRMTSVLIRRPRSGARSL